MALACPQEQDHEKACCWQTAPGEPGDGKWSAKEWEKTTWSGIYKNNKLKWAWFGGNIVSWKTCWDSTLQYPFVTSCVTLEQSEDPCARDLHYNRFQQIRAGKRSTKLSGEIQQGQRVIQKEIQKYAARVLCMTNPSVVPRCRTDELARLCKEPYTMSCLKTLKSVGDQHVIIKGCVRRFARPLLAGRKCVPRSCYMLCNIMSMSSPQLVWSSKYVKVTLVYIFHIIYLLALQPCCRMGM